MSKKKQRQLEIKTVLKARNPPISNHLQRAADQSRAALGITEDLQYLGSMAVHLYRRAGSPDLELGIQHAFGAEGGVTIDDATQAAEALVQGISLAAREHYERPAGEGH